MSGGRLIRDMRICNVEGSMNNQILLTGGRPNSRRGFLSIIRYGLKLRCYLSVNSPVPVGIWTVKRHVSNKHHSFIVLSYSSRKTVTFLLDSNKMIQNNELRLDEEELTMNVTRFGDNSLVQVKAFSLKFITKEGSSQSIKIRGRVMKAASVQEGKQLLLSFIGGYFEYFEVCNGELRKIK